MSPRRVVPCQFFPLMMLVALLLPASDGRAQKPPPPVLPNPLAPVLALTGPAGMQRGTTLELMLTGTNLAGPTGLYTSFPAKVTIPTDNKNGQDNTKLRVRLEVPADAPLGFHSLRLATTRGMSNLRLFCIDDLPQVLQAGTNHTKSTPQTVALPCVVVGRLDAEASDYYRVSVKTGQRLTFEILGHRLGSPLDPQITLYDLKSQREIAYDNDAPGCQTDSRLTYVFKEAGDYLIEVKDVLNRGGPDFCYRLRMGDFPCATVPIPMAAKRGSRVTVGFAGPTVDGVAPVPVDVPMDPLVSVVAVAPRGANGLYGWPVDLAASDHVELVEKEPNGAPDKANRVPIPGGITGRFAKSNELDYYVFAGKKGDKVLVEAHTLEHNSPTLVYMVVKDASGKAELAKSNPQLVPPADQRIEFSPPADGDYLVEVQHLNYQGGPSEAYRLTLTPSTPGFDLSLGIERYDAPGGGSVSLPILTTRRGYNGPIEVSVIASHAGITGQVTIPAKKPAAINQPATALLVKVKPAAPNQSGAVLLIQVKPDVPMGPYTFTLKGTALIGGKQVTEYVNVRTIVSQNLSNLPYPPRNLFHQLALAVTEKPPFALAAKFDPSEAVPGLPASLTVTVTRDAGFTEAITLTPPAGLPPTIKLPALKPIPKGASEVKVPFTVDAKTPLGKFLVTVSGKAKAKNKEFLANTPPAALVIGKPFVLKVEPAPFKLKPNGKARLKITAERKGGYQGPIAVEVKNLPANVTAEKATIPMGQTVVEVEVTAANAAVASKMDVSVVGTATAATNQQNASPMFVVTIEKK